MYRVPYKYIFSQITSYKSVFDSVADYVIEDVLGVAVRGNGKRKMRLFCGYNNHEGRVEVFTRSNDGDRVINLVEICKQELFSKRNLGFVVRGDDRENLLISFIWYALSDLERLSGLVYSKDLRNCFSDAFWMFSDDNNDDRELVISYYTNRFFNMGNPELSEKIIHSISKESWWETCLAEQVKIGDITHRGFFSFLASNVKSLDIPKKINNNFKYSVWKNKVNSMRITESNISEIMHLGRWRDDDDSAKYNFLRWKFMINEVGHRKYFLALFDTHIDRDIFDGGSDMEDHKGFLRVGGEIEFIKFCVNYPGWLGLSMKHLVLLMLVENDLSVLSIDEKNDINMWISSFSIDVNWLRY